MRKKIHDNHTLINVFFFFVEKNDTHLFILYLVIWEEINAHYINLQLGCKAWDMGEDEKSLS